jgi:general secretion pathway protein G
MKKSFTLIEILVVATIIGLLAGGAAISYAQLNKQSRDAKRKADLEQIRAALEMYRSNNNYYPLTGNVDTSCSSVSGLSDATSTYLSDIPDDPKCPDFKYYYTAMSNTSGSCDNVSTYCTNYTLAAQLETTSSCTSSPGGNSCGTGKPCNYCLGPYGQK